MLGIDHTDARNGADGMRLRAGPRLLAGVVVTVVASLVCSCAGQVVPGRARPSSDLNQQYVAGLPVTEGPSGLRPGVSDATLAVQHYANTDVDRLAVDALSDLDAFWVQAMPQDFHRNFTPPKTLISFDSQGAGVPVCGQNSAGVAGTFYCPADDSVAWDRGELLPELDKLFGPMSVVTAMAHTMGHAVQARLSVPVGTKEIVLAQQADCYTGAFVRWVADGNARHFQVSTGDGLNEVLSSMMFLRDQVGAVASDPTSQGSSFDRVTAFQFGFGDGAVRCSQIDDEEVHQRIAELGFSPASEANDNVPVDSDTLALLSQSLGVAFKVGDRTGPPTIVANSGVCADGTGTAPTSFCPQDNTIAVDEASLNQLAALPADGQVGPADPEQSVANPPDPGPVGTGLGDFAAFSEVASRYALAVQRSMGVSLDDKDAGLRTACLTGAWAGVIRHETSSDGGQQLLLGPGDLDEAVAELLSPTSVIAADVHGARVPAGFARVSSFQDGFLQGSTVCTAQFG